MFTPSSVASHSNFYGREIELSESCADSTWKWICGPRRIGKSSFALELNRRLANKNWISFYYNCDRLIDSINDPDTFFADFVYIVSRGIPNALDSAQLRDDIAGLASATIPAAEKFKRFAIRLATGRAGVCIVFDEAEALREVLKAHPTFLFRLKSALRENEALKLVIVGAISLSTTLKEFDPEFIPSFEFTAIGALDQKTAMLLLQRNQTSPPFWEPPLPQDIAEAVANWTGGHPFMLHNCGRVLSNALAQARAGNGKFPPDLERIYRVLRADGVIKAAMENDFSRLTANQQTIMRRIFSGATRSEMEAESRVPQLLWHDVSLLERFGYLDAVDTLKLGYQFYESILPSEITSPAETSARDIQHLNREVFISYQHNNRDRSVVDSLKLHLKPRAQGGRIWDDSDIKPGDRWREQIDHALERVQAAVVLLSPEYINSEFVLGKELPAFFDRERKGGCRVYCLLVADCQAEAVRLPEPFDDARLENLQWINRTPNAWINLDEAGRNDLLARAARDILPDIRS